MATSFNPFGRADQFQQILEALTEQSKMMNRLEQAAETNADNMKHLEKENSGLKAQLTGLPTKKSSGQQSFPMKDIPSIPSCNVIDQTPVRDKGKRVNNDEHDIPMNDTIDERQDDSASEYEIHATLNDDHHSMQKSAEKTHQTTNQVDGDVLKLEVVRLRKEVDELKKHFIFPVCRGPSSPPN